MKTATQALQRLFGPEIPTRFKNAPTGFEAASKSKISVLARMSVASEALDLPFAEAIDFIRSKKAMPTKSHRDVWDAAHSKMFMVAGAATQALTDDFHKAIIKAIEKGTTLEEFRTDFDRIVAAHGWQYNGTRGWRSRIIFETNLNTAYAAGRYAQMIAPETLNSFPYWQYNHSGAEHPRLQHKAWDGLCLEASDPAWNVMYPPNGYNCGCYVTVVSHRGLAALGKAKPDVAPDLNQVGTDVKRGIDPSFSYNPGASWLTKTAPGPQAVSASEAQVAAFVRSALDGRWPDGSFTPVAFVKGDVAATLGVEAGTEVRLSADTIRSHIKHAIATPDAYGVLPKFLVERGRLIQDKQGRWALVGKYGGELYQASVKVVQRPMLKPAYEIYMVSMRRTERRNIRKDFGIEWD